MSPIPDVSREALLDAMARFDREERASPEWQAWETEPPGTQRYAIVHEGRHYPVKRIISMATGVSLRSFSGGDEANEYVRRRGLTVVTLRRDSAPHIWWVNQKEGFRSERQGGYIMAPTRDTRGGAQRHWTNLTEVQPSDIIVHYSQGFIRAVSRALSAAQLDQLPDGREARRIAVEYVDLAPAIPFDAVGPQIHELGIKDGPLIQTGREPKQGYLWPFSIEGLRSIRAASTAEWPDWAEAAIAVPRAWIFQADSDRYDVTAAIRELTEIHWLVRQHGDEIQPGHRVFIWVSGADAGVVAVGTVLTAPAPLSPGEGESRFYLEPTSFQGIQPRVRVHIDEVLAERIRRSALREHPVLRDLTIVQLAQGTNFTVTPPQAAALSALVAEHVPSVSGPASPEPAAESRTTVDFETLLRTLDEQGLYFPPALVANYVLALQTKRFVILTGISGTGKTQLALSVARAFQPRVQVDGTRRAAEGAVEQTVQPYMVKYHRLVLPTALRVCSIFWSGLWLILGAG